MCVISVMMRYLAQLKSSHSLYKHRHSHCFRLLALALGCAAGRAALVDANGLCDPYGAFPADPPMAGPNNGSIVSALSIAAQDRCSPCCRHDCCPSG